MSLLFVSGDTLSECGTPLTVIEPWHIKSFRPRWFGIFGEPAPIIYTTSLWSRKMHQISVVDIDKRDIEMRFLVDGADHGSRRVDLDPTVECGQDVSKCLELGFASGLVRVPPGRHTVRVEIVKREHSLLVSRVWGDPNQMQKTLGLTGGKNGREGLRGLYNNAPKEWGAIRELSAV